MITGSKVGEKVLSAFAAAGKTMMKQMELYKKLQDCQDKWEKTQDEKDFDELERLEEEYEEKFEYTTANEHDEETQIKYLKALDYGDSICKGWRRFYVCKAGGKGNYCGLAFPSKLWFQTGRVTAVDPSERLLPGNWKYKCMCMWEYLQEEAADHPGSPADEWFADMLKTYGKVSQFPHVGCGANFVPWKRGPSMVCEVQMRGASWEAFLAAFTPQALDDQLKKVSYMALSEAFGKMSPETMFKAIPMTMPMTHLETVWGKKMEGIARYPLDAWEDAGNPCFTEEKWAMMCLHLAEVGTNLKGISAEDVRVFENLFTVSSSMPHGR